MKFIEIIGEFLLHFLSSLGKFIQFIIFFFKYLVKPKFYLKNNLSYFIGTFISSIPIIALTGIFSGMVLALQSYTGFSRFSAESAIPNVVVLTLTRELGPKEMSALSLHDIATNKSFSSNTSSPSKAGTIATNYDDPSSFDPNRLRGTKQLNIPNHRQYNTATQQKLHPKTSVENDPLSPTAI